MRLSLYTDFTFRLIIHVAACHPRLVTVTEVSKAYGISRNHLTKIAHDLGRAGYLENIRGRNGGMRLACPAAEINVGELVRLSGHDSVLVECFDPIANQCVITPACKLKNILAEARAAFHAALDRYSIADIVARPEELLTLLNADSPA